MSLFINRCQTKWDPDNLHRHPDFAPVKNEPTAESLARQPSLPQLKREWPQDPEDTEHTSEPSYFRCPVIKTDKNSQLSLEMERMNLAVRLLRYSLYALVLIDIGDDFDEVDFSVPQGDHPDEVSVDPHASSGHFRRRNSLPNKSHPSPTRAANLNQIRRAVSPLARTYSTGPQATPQTPMNNGGGSHEASANTIRPTIHHDPIVRQPNLPMPAPQGHTSGTGQQLPPPQLPPNAQHFTGNPQGEPPSNESSNPSDHEPPVGFFTARAAETLQSGPGLPVKASAFNPHLESPSIRKTAGVDHTKTKPVGREAVSGLATAALPAAVPRANFVNPQADKTRRLGMPGAGASPLQNRSSYKPPSIKRPAESNGTRSALGDVTSASVNAASDDGGDAKRQRVGVEAHAIMGNGGRGAECLKDY